MGFGFESPDRPEARAGFLALIVEACSRYAKVANATTAQKYSALAARARTRLEQRHPSLGMHATADAINAGVLSAEAISAALAPGGSLGEPVQLPSLSNFESFFVLRALAAANATEHALFLVVRRALRPGAACQPPSAHRSRRNGTGAGCSSWVPPQLGSVMIRSGKMLRFSASMTPRSTP